MGGGGQRDPNASGQVAIQNCQLGTVANQEPSRIDLMRLFADGCSLYGYGTADPVSVTDETGLSALGLITILPMPAQLESYVDYNDAVFDAAQSATSLISSKFSNASFNQLLDLNWATDWSAGDFDYGASGLDPAATSRSEVHNSGDEFNPYLAQSSIWKIPSTNQFKKLVNTSKKSPAGAGAYVVFDKFGAPIYAGRTKDLRSRMASQRKQFGSGSSGPVNVVGIQIQGKNQRRGMEEVLIQYIQARGGSANLIQGVSAANKNRYKYAEAAKRFLMEYK